MITEPIAEALKFKYSKAGFDLQTKQLADGSFVISYWFHPDGIVQPDEATITVALSEYASGLSSESSAKRGRKRQLLDSLATLTGLTRKQVLKCFNEIVKDGTDD